LNFYAVVDPEIEVENMIQMPAETILLNRRYNPEKARVFKKIVKH
jgi:hypothetical protein